MIARPGPRKFAQRLCLTALAWIALGQPVRLSAAEKWFKVETPDVHIYSNGSKGSVQEFAVHYLAFRHAFNALLAPMGRRPDFATLLLFRDVETLRDYWANTGQRSQTLADFTVNVGDRDLFVLALPDHFDQPLAIALENDTQRMLRQVGYRLPIWMSQGAGEVLASLELHSGGYDIGDNQARFSETLVGPRIIPWDLFFVLSTGSDAYRGKNGNYPGLYQAQAWAIMSAVLLHGSDSGERFRRLAGRVHGGIADGEAVAGVTGVKLKDMHQLVSLGSSAPNLHIPFDTAKVKASLLVAPAPDAEVKVQLADLLAAMNNPRESDRMLEAAVALAPNAVYVKEAQGRRFLRRNDQQAATKVFREAIVAGSVDFQAYMTSALQRLDDAQSSGHDVPGGGGNEIPEALAEIRRSLEFQPSAPRAYFQLGRALYVSSTVTDKDLEELKPGIADPENGSVVRLYRGMLYQRLGRIREAQADLRWIIADHNATPALRAQATKFLRRTAFEADQAEAKKLVAAGKFQEAQAVVTQANLRVDGSTDVQAYADLKDWIADNEVRAKALKCYQQKDWADLRDIATAYLAANPAGGFAQSAHQL